MKGLALLAVAALLSSCSANWHLSRAVAKDPSLLEARQVVLLDTLIVRDVQRLTDTFTLREIDTVLIAPETPRSPRVKIIRIMDTFQIEATCPADTVRIVRRVEVPGQIRYQPDNRWPWWIWFGLGVVALFALLRVLRYV